MDDTYYCILQQANIRCDIHPTSNVQHHTDTWNGAFMQYFKRQHLTHSIKRMCIPCSVRCSKCFFSVCISCSSYLSLEHIVLYSSLFHSMHHIHATLGISAHSLHRLSALNTIRYVHAATFLGIFAWKCTYFVCPVF